MSFHFPSRVIWEMKGCVIPCFPQQEQGPPQPSVTSKKMQNWRSATSSSLIKKKLLSMRVGKLPTSGHVSEVASHILAIAGVQFSVSLIKMQLLVYKCPRFTGAGFEVLWKNTAIKIGRKTKQQQPYTTTLVGNYPGHLAPYLLKFKKNKTTQHCFPGLKH